jgi:hypothetical protein
MPVGPSAGMLKKVFDPAVMKKKVKSSRGYAEGGGNNIKRPDMAAVRKQKNEGGNKKMKLMRADATQGD